MPDFNPFAPLPTNGPKNPSRTDDMSVWQEGLHASCYKDATWPDRCVVCNAPAEGDPLKLKIQWHPRWVYFLFLLGAWWYVIAMLLTRKRATIHVGLCAQHQQRRKTGFVLIISSFFVLALGLFLTFTIDKFIFFVLSPVVFVLMLAAGSWMTQVVRPVSIDDERVWAKVGQPFLDSLPTNF